MKILMWFKKHFIFSLLIFVTLCFLLGMQFFRTKKTNILTKPLQKGSIMECVYGVGSVFSNKTFQVKSGISSKIQGIFVKEGDFVEAGTKLIELETTFYAPFAGTVISRAGSVGETVFPQTILVNLADLKDRFVQVTLDQIGALKVQKNQKVKLSFDGLREKTFMGSISAIYPKENHFLVHIDVTGLPMQILPGMTADVAIELSEHKGVFIVPLAALHNNQIYVKRSSEKPIPVTVKIGLVEGSMAEIFSKELLEGDQLVVQNKENR